MEGTRGLSLKDPFAWSGHADTNHWTDLELPLSDYMLTSRSVLRRYVPNGVSRVRGAENKIHRRVLHRTVWWLSCRHCAKVEPPFLCSGVADTVCVQLVCLLPRRSYEQLVCVWACCSTEYRRLVNCPCTKA